MREKKKIGTPKEKVKVTRRRRMETGSAASCLSVHVLDDVFKVLFLFLLLLLSSVASIRSTWVICASSTTLKEKRLESFFIRVYSDAGV